MALEIRMPWYFYLIYFFGGALLANAIPHLIAGLAGRAFPTPFASPPFKGLSSPSVNVAWALVNLVGAYLLLVRIRPLHLSLSADVGSVIAGFAAMLFQIWRFLRGLRTTSAA